MLRWRLIGAVTIIVPVLGLLWLDDQRNFGFPGIWFALLAILAASLCVVELAQLVSRGGHALRILMTTSVAASCMLLIAAPRFWPLSAIYSLATGQARLSWAMIAMATAVALRPR